MSKYIERTVDICKGITNGGVIIGEMYIVGCAQKRDSSLEMFGTGLASVEQRKIDYGEASKTIVEAQTCAKANRVGTCSSYVEEAIISSTVLLYYFCHASTLFSNLVCQSCVANHKGGASH